MIDEKEIGVIFNYFDKIKVAAIRLSGDLGVGDIIRVRGQTTDFKQEVKSIQTHNQEISEAMAGDEVGIKLNERARKHDKIFLVDEEE